EAAGFYFTAENERQIFIRKKELYDGAIPSGNSVMLGSLIKLSSLSDREDFSDKAMDMIGHFIGEIDKYPTGYTQMICGLTYAYGECGEITIIGDLKQEETKEMLKNISQEFLPNILLKHSKSTGMPTATLCLNKTCGEATSNIQDILSKIL
ncbi:MAG: hypothetical protein GX078_07700, partial [Clostridiales bacterium]|nr:hypothetical protein [Clostridiales bacterium]